jgi:hypothetical protein
MKARAELPRPVRRAATCLAKVAAAAGIATIAVLICGCSTSGGAGAPSVTTGASPAVSAATTTSASAPATASSIGTAPATERQTSSTAAMPTSTSALPPAQYTAAIDIAGYAAARKPGWFTAAAADFPTVKSAPEGTFTITGKPVANRKDGVISPSLVSSYLFLQFGEIKAASLAKQAGTLNALFIRSALLGFVDYQGNKVFDWDQKSSQIPLDVKALIREANKDKLPVFLELNYSDYIPGPAGTGVKGLARADNVSRTVSFLKSLEAAGLLVAGVTFGDEIGDDSGYGSFKPTLETDDIAGRFVRYATALRQAFPSLKIYAFDSYIAATRGQVSDWYPLLQKVRAAETATGRRLIDGFVFRESYVYMDGDGKVLSSQDILDDVESLAGRREVLRYDVFGNRNQKTDRAYLPDLAKQTRTIFGRDIDLGITEYLPAGPVQINESDTSKYADIDFLIHYADVVGTYAEQGFDVVSTWMFANTVDDSKCYADKNGRQGLNYPVHKQLVEHFKGSLLAVDRSQSYESLKVKVYTAQNGPETFVVVLNKDAAAGRTVRVMIAGQYDLTLRLAPRSYTSLLLSDGRISVSGV